MTTYPDTPVRPVGHASARESYMYAQLHVRGEDASQIGTPLTVALSRAWDDYIASVRTEFWGDGEQADRAEMESIIEAWDNNGWDVFGRFDALVDALWAAGYRRQQKIGDTE